MPGQLCPSDFALTCHPAQEASNPPSRHTSNIVEYPSPLRPPLPRYRPLRIVDLCGGLATGLEALLEACYAIASYAWVDIDPAAHAAVSYRLLRLTRQYLRLLPPEATRDMDSRLLMNARAISP
jgi:hypothetical protein